MDLADEEVLQHLIHFVKSSNKRHAMLMQKLKPAVPRSWLLILAGLSWSAVGLMLCWFSLNWLVEIRWSWAIPLGISGIALSIVAYLFGFKKVVKKNIDRICKTSENACVFAFQAWRSYLIIPLMIAMGLILRGSSVPKYYLAVPYTMMGFALFLASFHYYLSFWRNAAH